MTETPLTELIEEAIALSPSTQAVIDANNSLKNAISSGNISDAISYTKTLNGSLNDIRIVTGYNADQMAAFAVEANKAAKALSTTTTAYSDASLIYFQQGLSMEEVNRRTEATIKMAQATGESVD